MIIVAAVLLCLMAVGFVELVFAMARITRHRH